ncbi:pyridine nucleotide-disulfide oxidoreductase family protein [Leptothrix cholodnii SP-6]|uniref:Pyridine nucleotide-disulfide oxidoreductase family protein n=1 Tax=Leptothrix cholodnii (strain ATCC 51168 / LMG 8142 / SP-6) TaxID=395495 RepID=B1XY73_LEPCP|nr:FAD-dependent oxidoreductase [Leptothrix cholodnii]ACB33974.1 pyridine nucleotide-disulfide oxidoreductase family protein [Leptothrix cholodnii SP-6]
MSPTRQLLLIGGGHAHAQVVLDWLRAPLPGVALTLVSPTPLAAYSGMVPGWLAGDYRYDEICIDLVALCRAAGVHFIQAEVTALDAGARCVQLADGRSLAYDLLSLNIGSTLTPPLLAGRQVLSLRPLGALREGWERSLNALQDWPIERPLSVTAVGGGAAGAESLLAVRARLLRERPGLRVQARLVTRGPQLLAGMAAGAARRLGGVLAAAGVTVQAGTPYSEALGQASDLLLWATGAQAHAWPGVSGLAVDGSGFVRVDAHLRSVSHPQVWAVGDCAAWAEPLPKAGVYAVRMGPVLTRNLRAALGDGAARPYRPQRRYLALLATGDGQAIASWGALSAQGRWLWRWKDRIDRSFIARFRVDRARLGVAAGAEDASA